MLPALALPYSGFWIDASVIQHLGNHKGLPLQQTSSSMNTKISCQNVWKVFGATPERILNQITSDMSRSDIQANMGHVVAVRDVSFDVQEGEIFCVMGLSGSGKSTLIRCLTRLIEPTSGKIIFNDQNVTAMNVNQLRDLRRNSVSMVFQRFALFPHRRIIDNVSFGLEVRGLDRAERDKTALDVLDMVGLSEWAHHFPHELSGGMQQRVGLARALAVDPEVLLCDEPFSALDPLIRREMQDELLNLQQTLNKTIVFITHDFLESLKIGDRIAIMKDGEIVQIGTPEEIIANPANDYVREFTKDAPRVKVLTAAAIMQPLNDTPSENSIPAETTLEKLIPIISASDQPLTVTKAGQPVGQVDRLAVMNALIDGESV